MVSEQEAGKELVARNWSFTYFEELGRIDDVLKKVGIPAEQLLQLVEATNELKNPDFRAAAFDLLDLKKRTDRSSKEAEEYIKWLDSQMQSKRKQVSRWTTKVEEVKVEFDNWETKLADQKAQYKSEEAEWNRKRTQEKARFENEQARNRLILKEDTGKLARELKRNDLIRENVEETVGLKADLEKINLDLDTFQSIVRETVVMGGITEHIAKDVTEAMKRLGSLGKAIQERETEVTIREKAILVLSQQEEEKEGTLRKLDHEITVDKQATVELDQKIERKLKSMQAWDEMIEKKKWQYQFFEIFISMLLTSPSTTESLAAIGEKILQLGRKGWIHSTQSTPEQRRAVFIALVMGSYLHSIYCGNCKASFIVSKPPDAYNHYSSSYYCPVCHFSYATKPDDSFLNLMISPELAKKFQDTRRLLDIMRKADSEALMKKLALLDSLPKEVLKALEQGLKLK